MLFMSIIIMRANRNRWSTSFCTIYGNWDVGRDDFLRPSHNI